MFLASTPFCRCLKSELPPYAIFDRSYTPSFEAFHDMRCTQCGEGFIVNRYPTVAVPDGRARLMLTSMTMKEGFGSSQKFVITGVREGFSLGEGGAPFCSVSMSTSDYPGLTFDLTWIELLESEQPKKCKASDKIPPGLDELFRLARLVGFEGLNEGTDLDRPGGTPWACTEVIETTPDQRYQLRLLVSGDSLWHAKRTKR